MRPRARASRLPGGPLLVSGTAGVYVRHAAHRERVRRLVGEVLTGDVAYLTTGLCRADLLVEIEGMAPVSALVRA